MKIAIIGPSHAKQLEQALIRGDLNPGCELHIKGFQSAPIFIEPILDEVHKCRHFDRIYLYVAGSLRLNFLHSFMAGRLLVSEVQYDRYLNDNATLFDRQLMECLEVVATTDLHLQRWLDYYTLQFSNLYFIFWCEFVSGWKRARKHAPENDIRRLRYKDWANANPRHVDLKEFVAQSEFPFGQLLQPDNSHKNAIGRELFLKHLISYVMRG